MKNDLYEFPLDAIITSDEWDHVRYQIGQEIEACDYEKIGDFYSKRGFPFLRSFEIWIEAKLIKAGFKKEFIKEKNRLRGLVHTVNFEQGRSYQDYRWDINPPLGFPSGTYKISEDKHTLWFNPEIEAAFRTLESINIMKELLINDGAVNKEAVKVYLRSLELIINLSRAGNISKIANAEAAKKDNSLNTRELKKIIIRRAIIYIFDKYPKSPKTAGAVWNKLNTINKSMTDNKTWKKYQIRTGKNKAGEDIILITGDGLKKHLSYKKRTLERLVKEVRNLK